MAQPHTAVQVQDKSERQAGKRLALDVGMRVSVSLPSQTGEHRITGDIAGMAHFEYLILRLPWVPGLRARLVVDTQVTVRFINDGVLCGFQSVILTHVAKPSLLLFVAYPETVEKLSLRQHRRVHCALPARIHSSRGDAKGLVGNLSQGGGRLCLEASRRSGLRNSVAGDELLLRVHLDVDGAAREIPCVLRNVDVGSSLIVFGVSFVRTPPDVADALRGFLEQASLLGME